MAPVVLAIALISAVWVLVLVWFPWVRGKGLHTLLALGQGPLAICWAPAPPQDAVEGWHAGGGGGELSETRPAVQISCAPTSYVS